MTKTSLVLTILGQDRPGLVDSLAQVVAEHGGNWVESRMAHLAGQFAGILRVEVAADRAELLTVALQDLAGTGLESVVQPDLVPTVEGQPPPVQLSLVGQDRPGIIREISQVAGGPGGECRGVEYRVHKTLPIPGKRCSVPRPSCGCRRMFRPMHSAKPWNRWPPT